MSAFDQKIFYIGGIIYSCMRKAKYMSKGQFSLHLIFSMIILTIVAIVVIGMFVTVMKPPETGCQTDKARIISNCKSKCNDVQLAKTSDAKKEAAFEYCSTHFKDVCSGSGELVSGVYVRGSGYLSFCKSRAYCFNYPQAECVMNGETLGPEKCRDIMCDVLKEKEMNPYNAKKNIEELMKAGMCNLKSSAHEEIVTETWWEKYFQDVDCSSIYGTS